MARFKTIFIAPLLLSLSIGTAPAWAIEKSEYVCIFESLYDVPLQPRHFANLSAIRKTLGFSFWNSVIKEDQGKGKLFGNAVRYLIGMGFGPEMGDKKAQAFEEMAKVINIETSLWSPSQQRLFNGWNMSKWPRGTKGEHIYLGYGGDMLVIDKDGGLWRASYNTYNHRLARSDPRNPGPGFVSAPGTGSAKIVDGNVVNYELLRKISGPR